MTTITQEVRGIRENIARLKGATRKIRATARKMLNAAGKEYQAGIRAAVPPAKTKGHSSESVKNAIGYRVTTSRTEGVTAKVGIGVGMKRGTYRPNAVFLAVGTQDRWTGFKQLKKRIRVGQARVTVNAGLEFSGAARKFRGRIKKTPFVVTGVNAATPAANAAAQQIADADVEKMLRGSDVT